MLFHFLRPISAQCSKITACERVSEGAISLPSVTVLIRTCSRELCPSYFFVHHIGSRVNPVTRHRLPSLTQGQKRDRGCGPDPLGRVRMLIKQSRG